MTRDEFIRIAQWMQAHWYAGSVIPDGALAVYASAFADSAAEDVQAAVEALAREGRARMPTAGEIVAMLIRLEIDPPAWGEVAPILQRAAALGDSYVTFPEGDGPGVRCDPRAEFVARQHGLIQSFVRTVGWDALKAWEPGNTTAEAQFRRKWEEHVQAALSQRSLVGLRARLPAVERARLELPERLGKVVEDELRAAQALAPATP